jgi:hypothetical protein
LRDPLRCLIAIAHQVPRTLRVGLSATAHHHRRRALWCRDTAIVAGDLLRLPDGRRRDPDDHRRADRSDGLIGLLRFACSLASSDQQAAWQRQAAAISALLCYDAVVAPGDGSLLCRRQRGAGRGDFVVAAAPCLCAGGGQPFSVADRVADEAVLARLRGGPIFSRSWTVGGQR